MSRRISVTLVSVLSLSLLVSARKKEVIDPVFGQIDSIVKSLSEISGFAEIHPVPYGSMSKRQLRQFLSKRIKKTLQPDEIRADELALKLFGLVPQDFDLKKSTIDLLTEQAAAFYDYDDKKLFLLGTSSLPEETTTLAHELSHALADQHFDLSRYMDESPANDDENLAHTAVVEGQASWLMIAYDLAQAGKPPEPTAEMLSSLANGSDTATADYPVLKGSPIYIQQSLLFPYSEGITFFDAVYKKRRKGAFGEVFTDAPVSSAEIIHPERYFAHEKPTEPELPKLALRRSPKTITDGSVGEFDHRMLLWQYLGEAKALELAPHTVGSHFRVLGASKKSRPLLEYVSEWDSERTANEFFAAYKKILRGKWKRCDPSIDNDVLFAGTGDNGYFITYLAGVNLVSIEGLSDAADWEELKLKVGIRSATGRAPATLN